MLKGMAVTGKEVIAVALIAAATTLVAVGTMSIEQWKEFSTYIFGFYASAKAITMVGTAFAKPKPTTTPSAPTQDPVVAAPVVPEPASDPELVASAPVAAPAVALTPKLATGTPPPLAPATGASTTAATVVKITPILVLALIFGVVLLGGSGCTKNGRTDTIKASLAIATVTVSTFHTYEKQHELDIVKSAASRADADAKLLEFYTKRAKFNTALNDLLTAIATASVLNDDQSLAAIATAAENLNTIVKDIEGVVKS